MGKHIQEDTSGNTSTIYKYDNLSDGSGKALYKFDGNGVDESGVYNANMINVGYSSGKFDSAVDTVVDLVSVGSTNAISSGFAVFQPSFSGVTKASQSVWIKRNNGADITLVNGQGHTNGQRGFTISLIGTDTGDRFADGFGSTANTIRVYNAGNTNTDIVQAAAYTAPIGTWFNFTWTFDGSIKTFKFYVNGSFIGSVTESRWTILPDISANTGIANKHAFFCNTYTGVCGGQSFDQLRIYDKLLTIDEIQSTYNEESMHANKNYIDSKVSSKSKSLSPTRTKVFFNGSGGNATEISEKLESIQTGDIIRVKFTLDTYTSGTINGELRDKDNAGIGAFTPAISAVGDYEYIFTAVSDAMYVTFYSIAGTSLRMINYSVTKFEKCDTLMIGTDGLINTTKDHKLQVGGSIAATAINFNGLPTSATGLNSGDVWSNSGVLTIVP